MLVVVALPQPTTIGMPPIRLHAARVSNCRYRLVRPYNIPTYQPLSSAPTNSSPSKASDVETRSSRSNSTGVILHQQANGYFERVNPGLGYPQCLKDRNYESSGESPPAWGFFPTCEVMSGSRFWSESHQTACLVGRGGLPATRCHQRLDGRRYVSPCSWLSLLYPLSVRSPSGEAEVPQVCHHQCSRRQLFHQLPRQHLLVLSGSG